ncbi:MAG: hypothetical protein ACRCX2_17730 [Paraclostridium sp.]
MSNNLTNQENQKVDLFQHLEERGKSVLGSFIELAEGLPLEKIEQLEMSIANFKAGRITKSATKYFLIAVLGQGVSSLVEDLLNIDMSVITNAFAYVGNIAGLFLALGLTLDVKRAWEESGKMSAEQISTMRASKVKKADDFLANIF